MLYFSVHSYKSFRTRYLMIGASITIALIIRVIIFLAMKMLNNYAMNIIFLFNFIMNINMLKIIFIATIVLCIFNMYLFYVNLYVYRICRLKHINFCYFIYICVIIMCTALSEGLAALARREYGCSANFPSSKVASYVIVPH